jgi:hypothetical protein
MADLVVSGLGLALRAVGDAQLCWGLLLVAHTVLAVTFCVLVLAVVLGPRFAGFLDGVDLVGCGCGRRPPPPPGGGARRRGRRVRALAAPAVDSDTEDNSDDGSDDGGGEQGAPLDEDEEGDANRWNHMLDAITLMWSDDGVLWNAVPGSPIPDCQSVGGEWQWHTFNRRGTNRFFMRGKCRVCGIMYRRRLLRFLG